MGEQNVGERKKEGELKGVRIEKRKQNHRTS